MIKALVMFQFHSRHGQIMHLVPTVTYLPDDLGLALSAATTGRELYIYRCRVPGSVHMGPFQIVCSNEFQKDFHLYHI